MIPEYEYVRTKCGEATKELQPSLGCHGCCAGESSFGDEACCKTAEYHVRRFVKPATSFVHFCLLTEDEKCVDEVLRMSRLKVT